MKSKSDRSLVGAAEGCDLLRWLIQNPLQNLINDPGSHGDQHNVAARTAPFVPG